MSASSPTITIWPEPPGQATGSGSPAIFSDNFDLLLAYYAFDPTDSGSSIQPKNQTQFEKIAVIRFKMATIFKFGYPNSEALRGHPLYKHGLKFYRFHLVQNSPWVAELCAQNRVHPRHLDSMWDGKQHWIATFEDDPLEVIAIAASVVGVFDALHPQDVWKQVLV